MIIEALEKRLELAKKAQTEATIFLMQKEQILRSNMHSYLEDGLTLLGKGVIWGRKLSEAFSAQTHRRAEVLKKTEEAFDRGTFEPVADEDDLRTEVPPQAKMESSVIPEETLSAKQLKKINRRSAGKKSNLRERRVRAHSNGAIRSH